MADFEDSNSPMLRNMIGGRVNLRGAVRGTIEHEENGKQDKLDDEVAMCWCVRAAATSWSATCWSIASRRPVGLAGTVGLSPNSKRAPGMAPRLVDFGFYVFHNARALLERGGGPYVYLPKIESHREARLWNDVFNLAEDHLGLQRGTVKATVPDRAASGRVRDG
jgi:malate synthase